ncbi:MAG: 50S ribosomal protein L11 methyltransferase [Gammaproteobacteria bacterium]|nr:50S ribosomal protein L11 methyltransferase [Gammaproteobacteria bacterium]
MYWMNVSASSTKGRVDLLEAWFWDHGAVSVTVEDGLDKPIFEPPPGEHPLWDEVMVTGLFESDISVENLTMELARDSYKLEAVARLDDRAWEREWLSRFKPMQFGRRLWVCPTGFSLEPGGKVIIELDPGLAFGTGTHETTRLCLEYLDSIEVGGLDVIDYGCGSGILAIASALLGAKKVTGIDNDPQALTATTENARRNLVTVGTHLPGVALLPSDIVLANILAQPLVEMAPMLVETMKPGGLLILSGIMSSQADWVLQAYVELVEEVELIDRTELNGWVRLVWKRT